MSSKYMRVTSPHNPLLKSVRRAASLGRPTEDGLIVAEGPHLLAEALRGKWPIEKILVTPAAFEKHQDLIRRSSGECLEIPSQTLGAIADTETNQGVITLLCPRDWSWSDLLGSPSLIVVLDGIQDPGNAGTIIRSAEAFGATGVVFLKGSVRVSNAKFLRAAAGSIFRMPFREAVDHHPFLEHIRESGLKLYGLSPSAEIRITDIDFAQPLAIAVGSEGAGLSDEMAGASETITIPMRNVESLNAAVSGSLALFEAFKQRSGA